MTGVDSRCLSRAHRGNRGNDEKRLMVPVSYLARGTARTSTMRENTIKRKTGKILCYFCHIPEVRVGYPEFPVLKRSAVIIVTTFDPVLIVSHAEIGL